MLAKHISEDLYVEYAENSWFNQKQIKIYINISPNQIY